MPRSPKPPSESTLRRQLVAICRRLHDRDLLGAAEGNVSCRLGPGRFLVTPSGLSKALVRAEDLVVVDGNGERRKGKLRPTSELPMHLAAFAARPDVAAAVHAHPVNTIALTVAGLPPPTDLLPEAAVALGAVAVAPFATPGTDELPAALAPLLPGHDAILLERHGALCLGRSLLQAFDRMETLERVSRVAVLARLLGRCEPLPPEAVARVLEAARRAGLR